MSFTFDGHDLTQYAWARIERPVGPRARVDTEQVPGRDGLVIVDVKREPVTIIAHMTLRPSYVPSWEQVRSTLAAQLSQCRECELTLPDEFGTYRMATASFVADVTTPPVHPVQFDIEFTCHSPVAYSIGEMAASLPSGGSVRLDVGGHLPARLSVLAPSAIRSPSTQLWGVRLDGGDYMRVRLAASSSRRVEIDGAKRTVKVAGATDMLTLDSNWIELAPGEHTLAMDQGTGAATVTWVERWL